MREAARVLTLALAVGLFPHPGSGQLSPVEALASFQTAEDVRVELVASEPLVASPCALAFDERGRMFVAENRGYPDTEKPPQGIVALLADTDGDGKMDRRTVFADGLTYPNGVLPWKGGVIVTCAPDVFFLKDTDGDGRADERRVLLTGFDTSKSTQLRVNAPTVGPDGWIYLAAGLAGGTITCPEHPERAPLAMKADVRFHPETLEVENVDGRSQYGQAFDDYGRRFICMNRLPVQHVVMSSKWLARNPNLAISETVQDCSERKLKASMKGGGDGVRLFPISANITTADSHAGSFSAACSVRIWRGGSLPARYVGAAFSCDPTGNLIHVDRLEPHGATYSAVPLLSGHEFLASRDDYFRPVFLARGPEGALYVADMYRKVIEHPEYLPAEVRKHTDFETGKTQGRIWRITSKEAGAVAPIPAYRDELTPIASALDSPAAAAELAGSADPRLRFNLALLLGDSRADFAVPLLASLAVRDAEDRWMRAAVLSGIAGREDNFLRALWPKLGDPTSGKLALLEDLGRSMRGANGMTRVLDELGGNNEAALAALLSEWPAARNSSAFLRAIETAPQRVLDASTPLAVRLLFIRLLGRSSWDAAGGSLQQAMTAAPDDEVRGAIVRSLAALDPDKAAATLLAAGAWMQYSPGLRESVLAALFARHAKIEGLLAAIESGALPVSALNSQRRQVLTKHADAGVRERAAKVFAATETTRAASEAKTRAALSLAAKPEHGQAVFKQVCSTCHRLEREGVAVGPDLFDIRKQPKENIAFHIVAPDAEVAPAFTGYLCETKDGRTLIGILASETPTSVTLRQPGGTEESVLRADVKSLSAMPGSLMPAGLDAAMSPQDFADLLAFLKGEK